MVGQNLPPLVGLGSSHLKIWVRPWLHGLPLPLPICYSKDSCAKSRRFCGFYGYRSLISYFISFFFCQYSFCRFVLLLEYFVYFLSVEWAQNKKIWAFIKLLAHTGEFHIFREGHYSEILKSYLKLPKDLLFCNLISGKE